MTPNESQMHNLGRQAREADFPIEACNLGMLNPLRVWWIAGWHDLDVEKRACEPVEKQQFEGVE